MDALLSSCSEAGRSDPAEVCFGAWEGISYSLLHTSTPKIPSNTWRVLLVFLAFFFFCHAVDLKHLFAGNGWLDGGG